MGKGETTRKKMDYTKLIEEALKSAIYQDFFREYKYTQLGRIDFVIAAHNTEQREKTSAYRSVFLVLTMDRKKLYDRIDRRVDRMMEAGLLAEVARLRDAGIPRDSTAMQGIGYKQIYGYLEGDYDLAEAVRLTKRDSRRFAKRQLTWFRREKDVIWVDLDQFDSTKALWDHMQAIAEERLTLPGTCPGSIF